jgi:hypothetical protein
MALMYNPRAPEMYNQVRGMPMAGGRPNGYGAPRRAIPGPTNVMPMGGPRMPEVNAGAPMQGNPLMGQFPSMPSRYGNSMGQTVAREQPPPTQPGPGMPVPPRPAPPPSKYPPTGPQRSGTEMRAPQPYQQPAPAAEHSPRFMQMLENTARMNDVERANYINSQRDALMERLARYDFAKNRGLQLDESAQADYDNIAAMMQEINRYNEKIAKTQELIDASTTRYGGDPLRTQYMDELARYRTGGYGI